MKGWEIKVSRVKKDIKNLEDYDEKTLENEDKEDCKFEKQIKCYDLERCFGII